MLGLSLPNLLQLQSAAASESTAGHVGGGPGWGKAKSIILVYLQGGPSQLDLWDPKENVPDNVASIFKPISTKIPGIKFTENLPQLSQINDRFTMIRSMSYTPNGLFNHTAAIYQMMTGYTTDKVSPSGQLEPPSPKDFAATVARIQRRRQGRHRRVPWQSFRPVHALSDRRRLGHEQDGSHSNRRFEIATGSVQRPPATPSQTSRFAERTNAGNQRSGRVV
jgi:hypothetical protein